MPPPPRTQLRLRRRGAARAQALLVAGLLVAGGLVAAVVVVAGGRRSAEPDAREGAGPVAERVAAAPGPAAGGAERPGASAARGSVLAPTEHAPAGGAAAARDGRVSALADAAEVLHELPRIRWTGTVRDAEGGLPIEGVRVVLTGVSRLEETRTDERGAFALRWPEGEPAAVALVHPAHVDVRAPAVSLAEPGDFRLQRSASLGGRLLPAPRAAASVRLWHKVTDRPRDWPERAVPAGKDGDFELSDLEPGEYALTAFVPGGVADYESSVLLRAGERRTVQLPWRPGAVLRGTVTTRAGEAVADAALATRPLLLDVPERLLERGSARGRSAPDGTFALSGLGPGRHELAVELPWGGVQVEQVAVPASGDELELDVVVPGPASVAGRVLDGAGRPASDVRVRLAPVSTAAADALATRTDAGGAFRFEAAPARVPLVLTAGGEGAWGRAELALAPLGAGEERTAPPLELPAGAALRGVVRGAGGEPLSGARVEVLAPGASGRLLAATLAGKDGGFRVAGLDAEPCTVRASHGGHLPRRVEVRPEVGAELELELVLRPATGLSGIVLDADGFGVGGVRVRIRVDPEAVLPPGRGFLRRVLRSTGSDAAGGFAFTDLPGVPWVAESLSPEWELVRSEPRAIVPGTDELLVLHVAPVRRVELATIVAEVVDPETGTAPPGLEVRGLRAEQVTVDGARLRATGVEPGTLRLELRAPGHPPVRLAPGELRPGDELDLGLVEMERGTRLTVLLRDGGGEPVADARVRLRAAPASDGTGGTGAGAVLAAAAIQDAQGLHRFEAVPRGRWRLTVLRPGRPPLLRTVDVLPLPEQDLVVELP